MTCQMILSLTHQFYTHSLKNNLSEGGIGSVLYSAINMDPSYQYSILTTLMKFQTQNHIHLQIR